MNSLFSVCLYWIFVWLVYFFIVKRNKPQRNYLTRSLFFILASFVPILVYKEKFLALGVGILYFLGSLLLLSLLVSPHGFWRKAKWLLIFNFFSVLFQQVMVSAFWWSLSFIQDIPLRVLCVGLLFGASHLPSMFILSLVKPNIYIASSFLGGIMFAFLRSFSGVGFGISAVIHYLFYAVLYMNKSTRESALS